MRLRTVGEAGVTKLDIQEVQRTAARQARDKANAEAWNANIAIFLFAILSIIIILGFQGIGIEIAAPVAIVGLGMGWIVGWRQARQLYRNYYDEELARFGVKLEEPEEETVEEMVRKALIRRWKNE
ncbi:hypothetical protein ACFLWS_02095 [Chloroflexota bacterium]